MVHVRLSLSNPPTYLADIRIYSPDHVGAYYLLSGVFVEDSRAMLLNRPQTWLAMNSSQGKTVNMKLAKSVEPGK